MISGRVNLYKKRYKSSRAARTGNASLDFLPSLIHDYVSIFRKVTAENENLPGPQLVYTTATTEYYRKIATPVKRRNKNLDMFVK